MHLFEIEGGWFGLPLAGENAILWIDIRPYKTLLEYLPGTSSGSNLNPHTLLPLKKIAVSTYKKIVVANQTHFKYLSGSVTHNTFAHEQLGQKCQATKGVIHVRDL